MTGAPDELPRRDPFTGPDWSGAGTATATGVREDAGRPRRRRMSEGTRKRWRRRRRVGYLLLGATGLFVLAGGWVAVTAILARTELNQVKAELGQLKSQLAAGDIDGARGTADQLEQRAHHAHTLTSGPVWTVAAAIPGIGRPLATVRGITGNADELARTTVPNLVAVSRALDPRTIRVGGDRYDVSGVAAAAPAVHQAVQSTEAAADRVAALPAQTWLPAVDQARMEFVRKLRDLGDTLTTVDRAVSILPPMLGADGPKRYFVGFQNDAEARGLGGLPGAFAVVVADHGKLTFTHLGQDTALAGVPSGLDLGPDYAQRYGVFGLGNYLNSTISPHFPWVGQIWAAMWQNKSGEHVDGAIAVDPTALSYLLRVTGPATMPDGQQITADNVVGLTQNSAYQHFGTDVAARKQYLLDVAAAVQKQVVSGTGETRALIKAADKAATERRILVWSADPAIESALQQTSLGGQLTPGDAPFSGVVVTNAGGNKLDYYLDRTVNYLRTGCGPTRQAVVTVTLTNTAPASGLAPYVTERGDHPPYATKPGDNKLLVSLYATHGATLQAMTLDGEPVGVTGGSELGHPVWTADIELPRGTSRTFVYHLTEPASTGSVTVLRQPLVRPLHETVTDQSCGQ